MKKIFINSDAVPFIESFSEIKYSEEPTEKVFCGEEACARQWGVPCDAPSHPGVPIKLRKMAGYE